MREKKPINIQIGQRVRFSREQQDMTRDVLAEKTNLSVRFLACVESGAGGLSMGSLLAIAKALHVSCDYLVTGNTIHDAQNELVEMVRHIPPLDQKLAAKYLALFFQSADHFNQ